MGWMTNFFIEKLTQTNTPLWNEEKCLGYKKTIDCEKCQQVCPTGAVSIRGKKVIISSDSCNECGYCEQQCPAGALAFSDDYMGDRVAKATTLSPRVLSCKAHAREGDLTFNCLLALHKETMVLMGLLSPGEVTYFNLSQCEGCANNKEGTGDRLFWHSWRQANDFLVEVKLKDVLKPVSQLHDSPQASSSEVSRRDLVNMLKNQTISTVGETGRELIAGRKKSAYPLRKAVIHHLKKHWSNQPVTSVSGAGILASMTVDNKSCNACGNCERYCPQKAWSLQTIDGVLTLTHQASLCNDCRICQMRCEEKAISKMAVTLEAILSPRVAKSWSYEFCNRCKRRMASESLTNGFCPPCNKQELRKVKML